MFLNTATIPTLDPLVKWLTCSSVVDLTWLRRYLIVFGFSSDLLKSDGVLSVWLTLSEFDVDTFNVNRISRPWARGHFPSVEVDLYLCLLIIHEKFVSIAVLNGVTANQLDFWLVVPKSIYHIWRLVWDTGGFGFAECSSLGGRVLCRWQLFDLEESLQLEIGMNFGLRDEQCFLGCFIADSWDFLDRSLALSNSTVLS